MGVAALGIFVVVGALLGVGLWANANLRARGTALATATPVIVAAAATATPQPVVATVTPAAVSPTVAPTAMPTAVATVTPVATEVPTALPTVEPTLAAEVGQAYENFWRVRSQALLELDPTHLPEVMDGDYLAMVTDRIEQLRADGQAIKTHVLLNYSVVQVVDDSASVVDNLEDDRVYVRAGTEDPISEPTSDKLLVLYKLRKSVGTWKVIDSVRSQ